MKKVFGISDNKYAYFYELEIDNLDDIVSTLAARFFIPKKDVVLCDFYNQEVHNYGRYQNDINNGYANVIKTTIMHIDKRNCGISLAPSNPCFGVIELTITYPSQISRIVKNTFNTEYYNEQYKIIDFTDMIKIVNAIDKVPNNFTYDSVVDKKLKYMNTSFNYNHKNATDVNKKIYLNPKEKDMSLDDYYDIISALADNMRFKLVATYSMDNTYNEEIENMKRYAYRNSKLIEMPIFNPILKKLQVPVNENENFKNKKIVKKCELSDKYNDKYNVYLQNNNKYDIM